MTWREGVRRRAGVALERAADVVVARETPPSTGYGRLGRRLADRLAGTRDAFGPVYSPGQVDRVGSASRCLQLVCQQVATMPLRFRGTDQPLWVTNPDPVWFSNGIGDATFAAVWSMYAFGDALLWVTGRYEATGYPRTWTVLDPLAVNITEGAGSRRYTAANGAEFPAGDVLQISRNPTGRLRGTPALQAYASNLAAASAAEGFAADFYVSGGVPWGALKPDRRLSSEQATELQAQWVTRVGARQAAPAVLPPDVTFQQFQFNPKDLLLLESRQWDGKQIAAAFGVPAFMLNMDQSGGLNYSNPEMLFSTWWRTELYPVARRLEQAMSTWLPRGNWVEFDPSILLRPDLATLTTVWLQLLAAQVVTVDETRAAVLDLPPVEDGDALAMIDEPPGAQTTELDPAPVPARDTEGAVA